MKLKIPNGFRIVRRGAKIKKGDRFKNCDGRWIKTSDAGRVVDKNTPYFHEKPDYAGIYIRRTP